MQEELEEKEKALQFLKEKGFISKKVTNADDTFVYRLYRHNPRCVSIIKLMMPIIGGVPEWDNLNDNLFEYLNKAFQDYGYRPSTIRTYFKDVKDVMDNAFKDGLITTAPPKILSTICTYKASPTRVDKLCLTGEEVKVLHDYIPKNNSEDHAKRVFMIMCLCGCTEDVAIDMTPDNINESTGTIFYTTAGMDVSVPMHEWIAEYIRQPFDREYFLSNKNFMSQRLKCLARNAGIEGDYIFRGQQKKRCMYVSFATARVTFATILYNKGIDTYTIQSYMGYSSISSVYKIIAGYKGSIMKSWDKETMPKIPI